MGKKTEHHINQDATLTINKNRKLNNIEVYARNVRLFPNKPTHNIKAVNFTVKLILFSTLYTMALSQALSEKPKYFTIFDSVGEMASGMAYIHVAIPFNLTTFNNQADILGDYLFKISRVVDSNSTDKDAFLQNIRDIANFGQIKLERLKNRMKHIDQILPFDGDITTRERRTPLNTFSEDEIIDYENFINTDDYEPIDIKNIVKNQHSLKHKHELKIKEQIDILRQEQANFIKMAQNNNRHRFRRDTDRAYADYTEIYTNQINTEIETLFVQQYRIAQLQSEIRSETEIMNKKLLSLTNLKWTPDMDRILGNRHFDMLTHQVDMLHTQSLQIQQDMTESFRIHRDTSKQQNEVTYFLDSSSMKLPNWITKFQKLDTTMLTPTFLKNHTYTIYNKTLTDFIINSRKQTNFTSNSDMLETLKTQKGKAQIQRQSIFSEKRGNLIMSLSVAHSKYIKDKPKPAPEPIEQMTPEDFNIRRRSQVNNIDDQQYRKTQTLADNNNTIPLQNNFINVSAPITINTTQLYRQLQIEINEMLIQTIADLKTYIDTTNKLRQYTKLKEQGTKTEFFRFEDIIRPIPGATMGDTDDIHSRHKRLAPLVIGAAVVAIGGILGTFMGIYNTWEINKLKERLNESDKNHNLLVHVTQRQEEQIGRITENMNAICLLIQLMTASNPALIAEQISAQISLLETRLTMATNAVQQLQHRRLAVDFLDTWQLEEMHKAVGEVAKDRGYTLMPERISDYFQLEASYLRNGKDLLIMLHVPCIIHEQLLTIYKYIPLPFPIPSMVDTDSTTIADLINKRAGMMTEHDEQAMDALTIIPEAEMIAVSNSDRFQILSQADLAACNKRNKIYLCENHQVLHTDLTNSCLGSIYSNFDKGIKDNCKLVRKKLVETVYQLSPTNYLIFTPKPYKATIECKSGVNIPVFLTQIYKLHVPEDCKIKLHSHSIQSDYNIRISPEPLDIPWSLDPMDLPADILLDAAIIDNKIKTINNDLKILLNETSKKTDFSKMLNKGMSSPGSYPWFIWSIGIAAATALGIILAWYGANTFKAYKELKQQQSLESAVNISATAPQQNPNQNNLYPKFNL